MELKIKTDNEKVVEYFANFTGDLDSEIERLLVIGITVSETMQSSKDMDFVQVEVTKMLNSFNGSLKELETTYIDTLKEKLENNFDPDIASSYLAKTVLFLRENLSTFSKEVNGELSSSKLIIKEMLENAEKVSSSKTDGMFKFIEALQTALSEVSKTIDKQLDGNNIESFSYKLNEEMKQYFDNGSSLFKHIDGGFEYTSNKIITEINSLRELLAGEKGKAEIFEKTAIKGFKFEDDVYAELEKVANAYNDMCAHVGKESTGASKKGDIIYELDSGERIVVECKDESVGLKPMLEYLDEAMENRGCGFGILVVKDAETQLQKQVGLMNIYHGNKLFCDTVSLPYVIRFVRVVLAMSKIEESESVDVIGIKNELDSAMSALKDFANIRTKITNIKNSVINGSQAITEIAENLQDKLNNIFRSIENKLGE